MARKFRREKGIVFKRFNTASGKYYCNLQRKCDDEIVSAVSIPQAVSTIAILYKEYTFLFFCFAVSIPQAISTIAILARQ